MKTLHISIAISTLAAVAHAQAPEITVWRLNLDGATGSSTSTVVHNAIRNVRADVQQVGYNATDVWIRTSTVPSHTVGPFRGPNLPADNNIVFRITRNPTAATNKSATPLGPIGVCTNGVPIFNAKDARSYFNRGIWNQNAIIVEAPGFDAALGHPAPRRGSAGLYHYHQLPKAVLEQEGETGGRAHSPLIGYSFDGVPIYGPYGYANANGTGGIARMRSSYRLRNITVRQTLPSGQRLNPNQYGPVVSTRYPLGYYVEDFEYVKGLGNLDEHNGRVAVTPEYPKGTYVYYATIDSQLDPTYPYLVGPNYYGVPINQRGLRWPGGLTSYEPQVQRTGAGCNGATLDAVGLPKVPNTSFALDSAVAPTSGAVVYMLTGRLSPIVVDVFQCPLFVNVTQSLILIPGATDTSGKHRLALPIPQNNSLIGIALHAQNFATNFTKTTTSNAVTLLLK